MSLLTLHVGLLAQGAAVAAAGLHSLTVSAQHLRCVTDAESACAGLLYQWLLLGHRLAKQAHILGTY